MFLLRRPVLSLLLLLPIACCGVSYHIYSSEFHWKRIPAKFEAANKSYGLRGFACHLLVYKMSDAARQRLRNEGLAFLNQVTEGEKLLWSNWEKTPPDQAGKENWPPPICFRDAIGVDFTSKSSQRAMDELESSISKPGSYVSEGMKYVLVVNPETGSIISGAND